MNKIEAFSGITR